jgi:hypothetical protein
MTVTIGSNPPGTAQEQRHRQIIINLNGIADGTIVYSFKTVCSMKTAWVHKEVS